MVVSVAQVSAIRMLWGFSGIAKKVVFLKSVFSVVIEVLRNIDTLLTSDLCTALTFRFAHAVSVYSY